MTRDDKKFYLTPEGLAKLQKEHAELKNVKRPKAVERLATARGLGDLSENAEYAAARDDLIFLDDRLAELEHILKNATKINQPKQNGIIQLGSKVVIEIDGEINEFTLVGTLEANPARHQISDESPIGQALMGKSVGETVDVKTPIVQYPCKILEIK